MAQYFNSDESSENRECKSDIIVKGGVDFPADPDKRRNQGIRHMASGFGLAALSFFIANAVLHTFEIGWFLKALMALTFSVLVIKAYDKATGEQPTPLNGPIAHFTIILFALCLFTGYQNAHGKSAGAFFDGFFFAKTEIVEDGIPAKDYIKGEQKAFGIIKHTGETWTTHCTSGKTVVIKIRGTSAIVNGETTPTGDYAIKVPDDGVITVVGTDNITTSIEVVE